MISRFDQRKIRARAPARILSTSLALGLGPSLVVWTFFIGNRAFAQSPPVVGRPVDFSGAVGGPFVVQWIATPTALTAEDPITLVLQITGPGILAEMSRPALGKLDTFRPFAIENLNDRLVPGDPPRREFRYRVRPRTADVKEIPRLKFVYFNPRIVPAARGFQTTYTDPVPLTVKPRTAPISAAVSADVPDWMLEPPASDELFGPPPTAWREWLVWLLEKVDMQTDEGTSAVGWVFVATALVCPPVLCFLGLAVWRRAYPDAAKLAAGRRSRAAAVAVRAIGRAGHNRPELIAGALIAYLRDRAGLPQSATTPAEVAARLTALGCPPPLVAATVSLLHRCDAARFAPGSLADLTLSADADNTVLEWEAAWTAPGS